MMSANRNKGKGSELDELDDRKWKIFTAIIKNYLETGEPVGSRTISKYTDLNLSSATVEMRAGLEERGLSFSHIHLPDESRRIRAIACMWII